jgi:heme oxygenase
MTPSQSEPPPNRTFLPSTFSNRILQMTMPHYRALEGTPLLRAMVDRRLPFGLYVTLLAASYEIHRELDEACRASIHPAVRAVFREDMAKAPLLEADLMFLCGYIPECSAIAPREAAAAVAAMVSSVRAAAASDPLSLLGFLFATEGAALSGSSLRKHVSAAYGLSSGGLRFYSAYPDPQDRWSDFRGSIEGAVLRAEDQDRVAVSATEAFRGLVAVFRGLSSDLWYAN